MECSEIFSPDVFGPFYHAREVAAGLDVLTDTEVAGAFFDEGILSTGNFVRIVQGSEHGEEAMFRLDGVLVIHTFAVFFVAPAFD